MVFNNKLFKVFLPLATATTASIITAYLIISTGADKDKSKEEDPVLINFESKPEDFKEEIKHSEENLESKEESDPSKDKKEDKAKDEHATEKEKLDDAEKPEDQIKDPSQLGELMKNVEKEVMEAMEHAQGAKEVDSMQMTIPEKLDSKSTKGNSPPVQEENKQVANSQPPSQELPKKDPESKIAQEGQTEDLNEVEQEQRGLNSEEAQSPDTPPKATAHMEEKVADVEEAESDPNSTELSEEPSAAEGKEMEAASSHSQEENEDLDGEKMEESEDLANPEQEGQLSGEKSTGEDENSSSNENVIVNEEQLRKLLDLKGNLFDSSNSLQALLRRSR